MNAHCQGNEEFVNIRNRKELPEYILILKNEINALIIQTE